MVIIFYSIMPVKKKVVFYITQPIAVIKIFVISNGKANKIYQTEPRFTVRIFIKSQVRKNIIETLYNEKRNFKVIGFF